MLVALQIVNITEFKLTKLQESVPRLKPKYLRLRKFIPYSNV